MRSMKVLSGFAALLLVASASVALGSPLNRNAASKVQGNFEGRAPATRVVNRGFNFGSVATPTIAARPVQIESTPAVPQTAAKPNTTNRSFSLQDAPQTESTTQFVAPSNSRRSFQQPRYMQADRKVHGDY